MWESSCDWTKPSAPAFWNSSFQSMVVSEVPSGSMNDATKRRKDVHDELVTHSDSDGMRLNMKQRMILQWIAKLAMRQKTIK